MDRLTHIANLLRDPTPVNIDAAADHLVVIGLLPDTDDGLRMAEVISDDLLADLAIVDSQRIRHFLRQATN